MSQQYIIPLAAMTTIIFDNDLRKQLSCQFSVCSKGPHLTIKWCAYNTTCYFYSNARTGRHFASSVMSCQPSHLLFQTNKAHVCPRAHKLFIVHK